MSNIIDFNLPVFYKKPENFKQSLGNFIEDSVYFGGKYIEIISQKDELILKNYDESCLKIALKVAAYILTIGLFPLIMLLAKVINRALSDLKCHFSIFSIETELDKAKKVGAAILQRGGLKSEERARVKINSKKFIISSPDNKIIKIQEVVRKLGRGGFGVAYELLDVNTHQRTALKIAKPTNKNDRNALRMAENDLNNEVANLVLLNDVRNVIGIQAKPFTGILKLRTWNIYNNNFEVTYKGYEGVLYDGSLDKLKVHILPLKERFDIIYQVVKGVQHLHTKGLVHSDLKARNIFYEIIGSKIFARISDFGSAWSINSNRQDIAYTPDYTTDSDIRGVTHSFTSRGKYWSGKKMDIYGLGVTIFELLTGKTDPGIISLEYKLEKIGLKGEKYKNFNSVLQRMLQKETDNFIVDKVCTTVGITYGRPGIDEVVKAVSQCSC